MVRITKPYRERRVRSGSLEFRQFRKLADHTVIVVPELGSVLKRIKLMSQRQAKITQKDMHDLNNPLKQITTGMLRSRKQVLQNTGVYLACK